jgi:hypothetical protein
VKSIVVIPGLSPTWVDQHARHLAQRLTRYGRVMVVSSRGRARARIMPGEMGRESVLGAGQSGHPVWTGRLPAALGLRASRDVCLVIWFAGASALVAVGAASAARLRGEKVVLDEEGGESGGRGDRIALWALRRLANSRVQGISPEMGEAQAERRTLLAVCGDDRDLATKVLASFSGFSTDVVDGWALRLHTTFDAEGLLDGVGIRHQSNMVLEVGLPPSASLVGAAVVLTPYEASWANLAERAASSGAAGVVVGHAVAGRIARGSSGVWLATSDPSSILVAIEASTGAALDAPVSIEGLRASSDQVVSVMGALAGA